LNGYVTRPSCPSRQRASQGCASSCLQELFFAALAAAVIVFTLAAVLPGSQGNAGCQVSSRYPTKVTRWCQLITQEALKNGLPPDLVAALIWQESGGNPRVISNSGAVGLMQVMPSDGKAAKFHCKNGPCFADRPTTAELKNPAFNIQYGTSLLGGLVKHHRGDIREALKSYGPMDQGYRYADIVLSLHQRYGSSP
jgi:soluble lytic murein transglycosylase-like protein